MLVIHAHAFSRHFQRGTLLGRDAFQRQLKAGAIEDQVGHAVYLQAIEARGKLDQRLITARANGGNDIFDALVHAFVRYPFPGEQCVEMLLEICLIGIQTGDFKRRTHGSYLFS